MIIASHRSLSIPSFLTQASGSRPLAASGLAEEKPTLQDLPKEILSSVFSKLPPKQRCALLEVSKNFHESLVSEPFAAMVRASITGDASHIPRPVDLDRLSFEERTFLKNNTRFDRILKNPANEGFLDRIAEALAYGGKFEQKSLERSPLFPIPSHQRAQDHLSKTWAYFSDIRKINDVVTRKPPVVTFSWQDTLAKDIIAKYPKNLGMARLILAKGLDILSHLSSPLLENKAIALMAIANNHSGTDLGFIPAKFLHQRDFIFEAVKLNHHFAAYIPANFLQEADTALALVRSNGRTLRYLSPNLQEDPMIAAEAIAHDPRAFPMIGDALLNDREFVRPFLLAHPFLTKWLPDTLRTDVAFLVPLVAHAPQILAYVSPAIRGNLEAMKEMTVMEKTNARYALPPPDR